MNAQPFWWVELLTVVSGVWVMLVAIVSAAWVGWKFIVERQGEARAELDLDLLFVGRQDGQWLVEAVAKLASKGIARHWYSGADRLAGRA
jgi:hypothetical protein